MTNKNAETIQAAAAQEAVAVWTVTREGDPTFPRAYFSEAAADAMVAHITLAPFAVKRAPVTAAPVDGDFDGTSYKRMFIDACEALAAVSRELDCDPEQGGAEPILAAIAKLKASPPAAPGIDLRNALLQLREDALHMQDPGDTVNAYNRVLAMIDASPKGGSDALREAAIRARRCLAWACEQRPEFNPEYEALDAALQATSHGAGVSR